MYALFFMKTLKSGNGLGDLTVNYRIIFECTYNTNFLFFFFFGGVDLMSPGTAATSGLLYSPR
jgi:hypothetical protein